MECSVGLFLAILGAVLINTKNLANFHNSVKFSKTTNENTFKALSLRSVVNSRGYLFNLIGEYSEGNVSKRHFPEVNDVVKPNSKLGKFLPKQGEFSLEQMRNEQKGQ